MKFQYRIISFCVLLSCCSLSAKENNKLGISQGISAPAQTSIINYSNGFTRENPAGVIGQDKIRLSLQRDLAKNDNSDGMGAEFGASNGKAGFAVGYYDRDCTGCDADFAGAVGIDLNGLLFGVRWQEDISTLGALYKATSDFSLGFMFELNKSQSNNEISSYGIGFTYLQPQYKFSLDFSKRSAQQSNNNNNNDDLILMTPGIAIFFTSFSVSISYDMKINDKNSGNDDGNNNLWYGLGIDLGNNFHLAAYHEYANQWAFVGSIFF